MATNWYFTQEGPKQFGPVTARELKGLAATGKLLPTHMVRKDGMKKSVRAVRVKGLFPPYFM